MFKKILEGRRRKKIEELRERYELKVEVLEDLKEELEFLAMRNRLSRLQVEHLNSKLRIALEEIWGKKEILFSDSVELKEAKKIVEEVEEHVLYYIGEQLRVKEYIEYLRSKYGKQAVTLVKRN